MAAMDESAARPKCATVLGEDPYNGRRHKGPDYRRRRAHEVPAEIVTAGGGTGSASAAFGLTLTGLCGQLLRGLPPASRYIRGWRKFDETSHIRCASGRTHDLLDLILGGADGRDANEVSTKPGSTPPAGFRSSFNSPTDSAPLECSVRSSNSCALQASH